MKYLTLTFLTLLTFCTQKVTETPATSVTGVIADKAMVVSAHPLASKIGKDILLIGGNAMDAAIAVQFALQVVFPEAGNIGGGGFAVIRTKEGEKNSLDFREKAPSQAKKDMYLDENGDPITQKSRIGHLAAGVPGSVAGMWEIHQKYGSLPWADLVNPSVNLAFEGYKISELGAFNFNDKRDDFIQVNQFTPWVVKDEKWVAGDSVIQKDLAVTLGKIRDEGRDGFYKGIVADQIVKEMQRGDGLITHEDLLSYQAIWRDPVIGSYRGYNIISMPPPSSGGIALLQLLYGANKKDIKKMGHNTSSTIHYKTELERRVFADRATHLGDPDFYDVPQEMLLSDGYNDARFGDISMSEKTSSQDIKEGSVEIIESTQTTHFSIVDAEGNAVSLTTTLNGYYGCKVMVKGAGFFLNNEMDDFSAKPGVPNQFGLVGAEANAIQPEKRMLSSMTPTIVEKGNQLFMVVGTPGGSTIITSVFQTIMNVIDHEMTMQEAVNATRIHSQWLPDKILVEEYNIDEKVRADLENLGHEFVDRQTMGKVDAILILDDKKLEGAADYKRGDDTAIGY